MRIERVQYDGGGKWLDVVFDDGRRYRLTAELVRNLCEVASELETESPKEEERT